MRRKFLFLTIMAALLPAASVWAVPNAGKSAAQYLNQINEQTYQIQTQADQLEEYVRSGADGWTINAGFATDMSEGAQKLSALLDQVAAQPGATDDTRMQAEKMKSTTAELIAFSRNTLADLDPRLVALRADDVLTNTANIEELCNRIRSAAQNLLLAH